LIEAVQQCQVEVVPPCALSNHYHAVIFDRWGRYPAFLEHFYKLFARSQNALRGRWENFWSSEQGCVVKLVSRDDASARGSACTADAPCCTSRGGDDRRASSPDETCDRG